MGAVSLRQLPDPLRDEVAAGEVALMTIENDEHTPVGLVLPFPSPGDPDGVIRLGANLVKSGALGGAAAARMAGLSLPGFMDALERLQIEGVWTDEGRLQLDLAELGRGGAPDRARQALDELLGGEMSEDEAMEKALELEHLG